MYDEGDREIRRRGDSSDVTRTDESRTGGLGPFGPGEPTTVETAVLRATLVGVPRVPLAEYVYDHQLETAQRGERRSVALFDVENTGDHPISWNPANTLFVGDDDYTYQPASVSIDPSAVGPGCHTRRVDIPAGRRARVWTLVEALPAGVEVAEVIQTMPLQSHVETTRLTFSV